MAHRSVKSLVVAAAMAAGLGLGSTEAAEPARRIYPQGDLFYNYYTDGPATPAQMYVSPLPAPEFVGHTYITYQPLMPQAWLNPHSRRYVRFAPGRPVPVNYTRVSFW